MSRVVKPSRTMRAEFLRQRDEVRRERSKSPFFGTGMHPNGEGGLDSDNFVPGSAGYSFGSDGNAEFNALTLRDRIVGNDALTSPTSPQAIYAQTTNFGLSTSMVNKLTKTLTVPAGFTSVAITVTCRVFVVNPNTSGGYDGTGGEYVYGQANIAGYNGWALPLPVSGSNGSGTNISTFSAVLDDLTAGGSVLVQAAAQTAYASIASDPGNTAELSGLATWYR